MTSEARISALEYRTQCPAAKPTKYHNRRVVIDGVWFDSQGEANYWFGTLKPMERAGEIFDLQRQVRIPLSVNGTAVCAMVVDYRWLDAGGAPHYADFKGAPATADWKLKAKLFKAIIGSEIQIVRAA
jgi:hypothetical protein